jgi:hypothetical protein
VTDQLIDSTDFQARVLPTDNANTIGIKRLLYTPPTRNGAEFGADIKDFQVRVNLTSRAVIDLDPVAFEGLTPQERRVRLKELIFDSGLGFLLLRVWRTRGQSSVMIIDFPIYNSGLPSQVIQLASYWPDGVARISQGSRLEFELVNTGSGGLIADDYLDIWGTAIEEAWIPDPGVAALTAAVSAQSATLTQVIGSFTQAIATAIDQNTAILTILGQQIAAQNALIQLLSTTGIDPGGGGGPTPTPTQDIDTMRAYYHPDGTVTIDGEDLTVPAAPPAASSPAPATLNGITLKVGKWFGSAHSRASATWAIARLPTPSWLVREIP